MDIFYDKCFKLLPYCEMNNDHSNVFDTRKYYKTHVHKQFMMLNIRDEYLVSKIAKYWQT